LEPEVPFRLRARSVAALPVGPPQIRVDDVSSRVPDGGMDQAVGHVGIDPAVDLGLAVGFTTSLVGCQKDAVEMLAAVGPIIDRADAPVRAGTIFLDH
jgi:hypothetical protein